MNSLDLEIWMDMALVFGAIPKASILSTDFRAVSHCGSILTINKHAKLPSSSTLPSREVRRMKNGARDEVCS